MPVLANTTDRNQSWKFLGDIANCMWHWRCVGSTKQATRTMTARKLLPYCNEMTFIFLFFVFCFNTILLHLHKISLDQRQFILSHCQRCNVAERLQATDWYHWPLIPWQGYMEWNLETAKNCWIQTGCSFESSGYIRSYINNWNKWCCDSLRGL